MTGLEKDSLRNCCQNVCVLGDRLCHPFQDFQNTYPPAEVLNYHLNVKKK